MWKSGEAKELVIRRALANISDLASNFLQHRDDVDRLLRTFSELSPSPVQISYETALTPLEEVKPYALPEVKDAENPENVLEDVVRGFSIGSYDTSYHNPGAHFFIPLLLVNVGYWYHNLFNEGGSGNYAELLSYDVYKEDVEIVLKRVEYKVLSNFIVPNLKSSRKFLFMDESLDLSYTLSWCIEKREAIIGQVNEILKYLISNEVLPIGLHYTRKYDIVRGISAITGRDDLPEVSDRVLMNTFLDVYGRSPVLRVHTRALSEIDGIPLYALFIKLGEYNIVRVEFPGVEWLSLDDLHRIILYQSIVGGGFPRCMQKSHELAVLRIKDREMIEESFAQMLGIPASYILISKKQVRKRWPHI